MNKFRDILIEVSLIMVIIVLTLAMVMQIMFIKDYTGLMDMLRSMLGMF